MFMIVCHVPSSWPIVHFTIHSCSCTSSFILFSFLRRTNCLFVCFLLVWIVLSLGFTTNAALMSPVTSPSFLCVSLSPPSLLYRGWSERWEVSVPVSLISCLPAASASCLISSSFLLHFHLCGRWFLYFFLKRLNRFSSSSCFSPTSILCSSVGLVPCLTLLFPPCCPLRCFPNFWSPSGAAWRGPSLSSLPSRQERRWDSELSTTTTRRWTSCRSAGGFTDC